MTAAFIALGLAFASYAGEALPPTENEKALAKALESMLTMHDAMFKQTNVGASFYRGDTLAAMNEAPIEARRALAKFKETTNG